MRDQNKMSTCAWSDMMVLRPAKRNQDELSTCALEGHDGAAIGHA